LAAPVPSAGTIPATTIWAWAIEPGREFGRRLRPAWPASCCAQEHLTVIAPHYISEHKSDMRGIKAGWYAIEGDGIIFSGPFASRQECVEKIAQPTDGTMPSGLQRRPN
jgi:hypothetical protein